MLFRKSKKKSVLKDLFEISSNVPWLVGVVLAVISYIVFSLLAGIETTASSNGVKPDIGSIVGSGILKMFSSIFQYLLPFIFLSGAIASAYKKYIRNGLLTRIAQGENESSLNALSWREFEMMVGEAFRKQGYKVTETPEGPDGGVDLVLEKGVKKILVQCKHWKAQKVGVKTARELFGVLVDSGADEVNIVCSGKFTIDAKEFVKNKAIYLIDGEQLLTLIENVA